MDQLYEIYFQFLSVFPQNLRPFISILLAILLVYAIIQVVKKNFIYIILLVILLPASVPILRNIVDNVIIAVKFLLNQK